jgi:ABC-2 type transport system permease protein/sodium transport system permease protein
MFEWILSGRLWRMCVKELRETLRDRRTLFTLILMPLLVYPLLSMALQRLILTSKPNTSAGSFLVGVSDPLDVERLGATIAAGQQRIASDTYRPLRIEREPNPAPVSPSSEPLVEWKVVVDKNLDALLLERQIDLAIRIVEPENLEIRSEPNRLQPGTTRRFEVRYRLGDGNSEAAIYAFQRLLQSINERDVEALRQRSGLQREALVELAASPIGGAPSLIASIASVIPLILLLMTITGAVYPAIDLTAGERERGTMEALIATPAPRLGLLLSKYVAVVSVSTLTAVVNLTAMLVTLSIGGLGRAILGDEALPWYSLLTMLPLLFLFSLFFSAILLALCCIARSFKEAQAYLIPVMLLSIGPGVLSVLPGVRLTANMAVVPLFNMILLARDVLAGDSDWFPAMLTIGSTILYSFAAMAIAAKLFGRFAIADASDFSWKGFWFPSKIRNKVSNAGDLSIFLAFFFPIYFVATNTIGVSEEWTLANRLWIKAGLTVVLFWISPLAYAWWRGLDTTTTFRIVSGGTRSILWLPGLFLLVCSAWTIAHEIFVFSEWLGIASLRLEQIAAANETKLALQQLPLLLIWITMAIVPAISEEVFFRGFAFRSLQSSFKPGIAILLSAVLFGLFHVLAGSILAVERFLPTAALGGLLAWLAWRSNSLLPGILVHAGHNGLLFTMARYESLLKEIGWGVEDQRNLPIAWIATGIIVFILGMGYIVWISSFLTTRRPLALSGIDSSSSNETQRLG